MKLSYTKINSSSNKVQLRPDAFQIISRAILCTASLTILSGFLLGILFPSPNLGKDIARQVDARYNILRLELLSK